MSRAFCLLTPRCVINSALLACPWGWAITREEVFALKKHYETIVIFHPSETDDSVTASVSRLKAIIEKHSGTLIKEEDWGVKTLAFELKKQRKGRYVMLVYTANPAVVGEMETIFNVMENVLKYMTVKLVQPQIDAYMKKVAAVETPAEPVEQAAEPANPPAGA